MTGSFSAGLKLDRLSGGNADADPEAGPNAEASWVSLPDQLRPSKMICECHTMQGDLTLSACQPAPAACNPTSWHVQTTSLHPTCHECLVY